MLTTRPAVGEGGRVPLPVCGNSYLNDGGESNGNVPLNTLLVYGDAFERQRGEVFVHGVQMLLNTELGILNKILF